MATRKKHKDPPLPKLIPATSMAAPTGLLYFMAPMLEFDFEGELPFPCDDIEEAEHTIRKEIWGTSKPSFIDAEAKLMAILHEEIAKEMRKNLLALSTSLPRPLEP